MRIEFYEFGSAAATNADGRTDRPLLEAAEARAGRFELVFHAGEYFRSQGAKLADPRSSIRCRSGSPSPTRPRTTTCR